MPIGIKTNGETVAAKITVDTSGYVEPTYEDQKSRRILRQGVYQAVLQSPGLAGLGFTNYDDFVKLVEKTAEHVIGLVEK